MKAGATRRPAVPKAPPKRVPLDLGDDLQFPRDELEDSRDPIESAKEAAEGLVARATGVAHDAADTVMQAASEGAYGITRQVTGLLDNQVAAGAEMMAKVANSTRLAADDLEMSVPQVAGLVRSVADRIGSYADTMQDQTVEEMLSSATGFARRQPAVVFGLSAMVGFMLFRAFKNAPPYSAQLPEARSDDT